MLSTLNKFELSEYVYITPGVTSDDPWMQRSIDGWLGIYESCYVMGRCFDEGRVVTHERTHPANVLSALMKSIKALNQWDGDWVLGGGMAMNYHGRQQASSCVDFWLFEDKDQLASVISEMESHGVRRHSDDQPGFVPPDGEFWWEPLKYCPPDAAPVNIDLLVASKEFMAFVHASGIESDINGVRVRVVGCEALIVLRMRAYSNQDKSDLVDLLRTKRPFDRELVLAWLKKFKIEHRLPEMEALANENGGRRIG